QQQCSMVYILDGLSKILLTIWKSLLKPPTENQKICISPAPVTASLICVMLPGGCLGYCLKALSKSATWGVLGIPPGHTLQSTRNGGSILVALALLGWG